MQRRDRDVAVLYGLEIGSLARMPRRRVAADPVILPAARIETLDDAFGVDALAEPRHLHALKFRHRKIDIEDDLRIARPVEQIAGQARAEFRAPRE